MEVSQLFWYPPCTELTVTQSVGDNSIQSSHRSFWKFFRKFWHRETTFSTHALVDFLNEFISHNWVSSLTIFVMHVSAPIPEFSAPFCHTTVPHNIITVYTTQYHSLTQLSLMTLSPYTRHNTILSHNCHSWHYRRIHDTIDDESWPRFVLLREENEL